MTASTSESVPGGMPLREHGEPSRGPGEPSGSDPAAQPGATCESLQKERKRAGERDRVLLLVRARRVTRAIPRAVVCRASAARVWSVETLHTPGTAQRLELITPEGLDVPGCVTHRAALLDDDVTQHAGIRVTTPARTAFDCAHWLPRAHAVAVLDQFLRRGVDLDPLWHRTLSGRARDVLNLADRRSASPRESWLRVMLADCGLPRPAPQLRVTLRGGRHACLDLGWETYKVAVEYDGRERHTTTADRHHDDARREELRAQGWRIVVAGPDVIPGRAADLLETLANALIERGWRPGLEGTKRILARIRAARRPRTSRRRRSYG